MRTTIKKINNSLCAPCDPASREEILDSVELQYKSGELAETVATLEEINHKYSNDVILNTLASLKSAQADSLITLMESDMRVRAILSDAAHKASLNKILSALDTGLSAAGIAYKSFFKPPNSTATEYVNGKPVVSKGIPPSKKKYLEMYHPTVNWPVINSEFVDTAGNNDPGIYLSFFDIPNPPDPEVKPKK